MSTDTITEAPKRRRREPPPIRYVMSHAEAALALSISERTLDEWVAKGLLKKRRLTGRTVGYLVREVEDLAEQLPEVVPGVAT